MFIDFNSIFEKNFKIYFGSHEFPLSNYVRDLILSIKPNNTPSVLVYPAGKELSSMFLPYISLYCRYINYSGNNHDLTEDLSINERVYYKGRLGVFRGKKIFKEWGECSKHFSEKIRNSKAVKIEFAKGATEYVPEKEFYQLTRYTGDAKRLNLIGKSKKTKGSNALIETFELSSNAVSTLISKSTLYVKNKSDVDLLIKQISTKFGTVKKQTLSRTVPLTYWSSSQNCINYPGNKEGLRSVVDITCNLESAIDLLYDKEGIELVIIDLDNLRGLDYNLLEQIVELCENIKLIILLPFDEYINFTNYFQSLNYTPAIVNKKKAINYLEYSNGLHIQRNQKILFKNYSNRKVIFTSIIETDEIKLKNIYDILLILSKDETDNDTLNDLVSKSFGLLSSLRTYLSFDCSSNHDNSTYIKSTYNELNMQINELINQDSSCFSDTLTILQSMLGHLVKAFVQRNALSKDIEHKIKYNSDNKTLFVIQNNRMKKAIESYLDGRFKNKTIKCCTVNKLENNTFYDKVYVLNTIPNKDNNSKLFTILNASSIEFIYYESYIDYIKNLYNKNTVPFLLENIKTDENTSSEVLNSSKENQENEVFNTLSEIVSNYTSENATRLYFGNNIINRKNLAVCGYLVDFDEHLGIFKEDYHVHRINYDEQILDLVTISKLEVGDEILVLNENFRSGSFIEDVISILLEDDNFNTKYYDQIMTSGIWKDILNNHYEKNNRNLRTLYNTLKEKGLNRSYVALRNWINNDYIVGPVSQEDYKIIFSLNHEYDVSWLEAYKACNEIRKLHIRLRKDIGKMIVQSYFDNSYISDDSSYIDIDFMSKFTICEVQKVNKGEFKVVNYLANTIKRRDV